MNAQVGLNSSDDDLTCSVCLEQVNAGELIRSLPCLHQVFLQQTVEIFLKCYILSFAYKALYKRCQNRVST